MFVYYYYTNNYYYAISKALSSPSPLFAPTSPLPHTHIYTHTVNRHTHPHLYNVHTRINLFTKKEMHASYTVISMISTFAIKRFAMYLYILYTYTYYYISIMPLSWTACLINVARYLWMRILSGCLLNISLYSLQLNLMLRLRPTFILVRFNIYLFIFFSRSASYRK